MLASVVGPSWRYGTFSVGLCLETPTQYRSVMNFQNRRPVGIIKIMYRPDDSRYEYITFMTTQV
jgi:hypothetical protein